MLNEYKEAEAFLRKHKDRIVELAASGNSTAKNIITFHTWLVRSPSEQVWGLLFAALDDYEPKWKALAALKAEGEGKT